MNVQTMKRLFLEVLSQHPELFQYYSDINDEVIQVHCTDDDPQEEITINIAFMSDDEVPMVYLSSF